MTPYSHEAVRASPSGMPCEALLALNGGDAKNEGLTLLVTESSVRQASLPASSVECGELAASPLRESSFGNFSGYLLCAVVTAHEIPSPSVERSNRILQDPFNP